MTADQFYADPSQFYVEPNKPEQLPPPAPDPWPQAADSSYALDQSPGSVPEEYDPAAETLLQSGSDAGGE